jgi:HlyD family secretion protein
MKLSLATLKPWTMPILSAVGMIFALVAILSRPEAEPKQPLVPPPTSPFEKRVAGLGVVEPQSELIAVGTELPGVVREVFVRVGDYVSASAPLFALDTRATEAQILRLKASLNVARSQAADAAAQYAPVSDVSSSLAVAQDEINRRKFASRTAAARVTELEAQLHEAEITLQRLTVVAPIDGQILDVEVRPGEFAQAGVLATPLVRIGDASTLHVRVEIDEENLGRFQPNTPAVAYRRGQTDIPLKLSFIRQEPFVQAKQNLSAAAGQRVDTRVSQLVYALDVQNAVKPLVGEQLDVFIGGKEQPMNPTVGK